MSTPQVVAQTLALASGLGLRAAQTRAWYDVDTAADLQQLRAELAQRPDVAVVVAFGQLFPPALLDLPRLGCVNLHASLLPRWRGAAPIQAAIAAVHAGV